jgi:predicted RNA-binding protein with PUA-like domain
MAYWLLSPKSGLAIRKRRSGREWTGVRNYQARNNMRARLGDKAFIIKRYQIDRRHRGSPWRIRSSTDDERWECVDIRALTDVPKARSLESRPTSAQEMVLVRIPRLSQPSPASGNRLPAWRREN